jgi:protein-S-isoprenylcysteine O-methyltransferase Ste14
MFIWWGFNYEPSLPWYLAPLIWVTGVGLLWSTRFTSTLHPRIGDRYYILSAVLRPLGIALISLGWMEVLGHETDENTWEAFKYFSYSPLAVPLLALVLGIAWKRWFPLLMCGVFILGLIVLFTLSSVIYPMRFDMFIPLFWPLTLAWAATLFGLWSIWKLGVRQSLFYRKTDDPLVTDGPYALVRHPQLLAALLSTFFLSYFFFTSFGLANAIGFGILLALMIVSEERDLERDWGEKYQAYARATPGLFPDIRGRLQDSEGQDPAPSLYYFSKRLLPISIVVAGAFLFLGWSINVFEIKSPPRPRHSEAKTNLGAIFTCQVAYFAENNTYAGGEKAFYNLAWSPEGDNLFAYYCGRDIIFNLKGEKIDLRPETNWPYDVKPEVSSTAFTCMAIGNIDSDPILDLWLINDSRTLMNVVSDAHQD